jgi:hypothetical protein
VTASGLVTSEFLAVYKNQALAFVSPKTSPQVRSNAFKTTTVTASGLVTSEFLAEVYKNQALAFVLPKTSPQVMFNANRMDT